MANGYVYVLSNDAMYDVFKIGYTTVTVEERVQELSNATGVPCSFIIEFWCFTSDAELVEQKVFDLLSKRRVTKSREFFRGPLDEIIGTIDMVISAIPPIQTRFVRSERV